MVRFFLSPSQARGNTRTLAAKSFTPHLIPAPRLSPNPSARIADGPAIGRGIGEEEASAMIVGGFIEPLVKELPMEYAVEMNRLIQLQMEGSIG